MGSAEETDLGCAEVKRGEMKVYSTGSYTECLKHLAHAIPAALGLLDVPGLVLQCRNEGKELGETPAVSTMSSPSGTLANLDSFACPSIE